VLRWSLDEILMEEEGAVLAFRKYIRKGEKMQKNIIFALRGSLGNSESFTFPVFIPAPVASKIETLPGPKDLKLPAMRKGFATDLDGATVERSGIFSPNLLKAGRIVGSS
jgi:hypothetical protein